LGTGQLAPASCPFVPSNTAGDAALTAYKKDRDSAAQIQKLELVLYRVAKNDLPIDVQLRRPTLIDTPPDEPEQRQKNEQTHGL
jgi:hypothetical protein